MSKQESSKEIIAKYYINNLTEIRAFVRKRLDCNEDADDIVQNVFVKILTYDKMISEITLPCFVYTVARNLITDYSRRRNFKDKYEKNVKLSYPANCNDTEMIYSAHQITELLERGLLKIPEKCRNIYRMNIYDGMKTAEISEVLSENYKSVEHRLGVARKEMRKYMCQILSDAI
jgi:RNA polymerase sigma-70 factor (ECF subfamily)